MRRLAPAGTIAFALALTAVTLGAGVPATAATPPLQLTRIDDFGHLTAMASRPGTRTLYVIEQEGVVWSVRNGKQSTTPVLDLRDRVSQDGGERGLLGLAFPPDGKRLYVYYTDRDGNIQIDEFAMHGRNADPASRRNVLEVEHDFAANHNGGQLAFGPDGDLYAGLGDGGTAGDAGPGHVRGGNGQSLGTLLGKILRIDPTPSATAPYTVPSDNPFVGVADARPEIWAYGLRNPWRFSFDRKTGDLWIGDVGQDKYEEIDHAPATNGRDAGKGLNFGWNRLEGFHAFTGSAPANAVAPVYEISHDTGACAVIGGYVYRGTKLSGLDGMYLFSDNCDSTIRLLVPDGDSVKMVDSGMKSNAVSSFGQTNNGELYVLSLTDGVSRIDAG